MVPCAIRIVAVAMSGLLLLLHLSEVYCKLTIQQYRVSDGKAWPVEGVATYEFSGEAEEFKFQCIKDSDLNVNWRKGSMSVSSSQSIINEGVEFPLSNPKSSDAGVYTCSSLNNSVPVETVSINITADNPAANPKDESLKVVAGNNVSIQFYTSGLNFKKSYPDADAITWRFNDETLAHGTLMNDNRILKIDNVQESHAGTYRFIVTDTVAVPSQSATAITTLNVKVPPTIVAQPQDQMATEWTDAQLNCTASGSTPFNIVWGKVGGDFPSDTSVTNSDVGNDMVESVLTISSVRVSDEGSYFCNVTFDDGTYPNVSMTATLTVQPELRFKYASSNSITESVAILLHTTYTSFFIDCEGSGVLTWFFPNGSVVPSTSGDGLHQETVDQVQRLNFTSYTALYNGLYKCNSSLSVTSSLFITNENPTVYAMETVALVAPGINRTLSVYIGGSDPVPMADDVQWYLEGTLIDTSSPQSLYQLSDDRSHLSIEVKGKEIAGTYECRVSTAQGTDSAFINVTFPDPPQVNVTPSLIEAVTGDTVTFVCEATGELPFTIMWSNIDESDPNILVQGNTLTIFNITKDHAKSYTCLVTDEINTVTLDGVLQVNYAPVVGVGTALLDRNPYLEVVYEEGHESLILYCIADAVPMTTNMEWQFHGGTLPEGVKKQDLGSGHIQLMFNRPVQYTDEGEWTCVATNDIGTSTARISLHVKAMSITSSGPMITSLFPIQCTASTQCTVPSSPTILSTESSSSNDPTVSRAPIASAVIIVVVIGCIIAVTVVICIVKSRQ